MDIVKASGEKEAFSRDKLCRSLKRAGAPANVVEKVCGLVEKEIQPNTSTEQIAKKAEAYLQKENFLVAAKYRLKRAIMELGPAGFYFEEYVAAILREYGYKTVVGRIMKGKCLSHEIDILAEKENSHYIIELKYHNRRGLKTDVQVAMYTYARFLDIDAVHRKYEQKKHQAWVMTNTKFTTSAIRYANCMGMKMTGWRHPAAANLERLIVKKALYPVTVLPSAGRSIKERFAKEQVMFVRDLLKYSARDLGKRFNLRSRTANKLLQEAYDLV